MDKKRFEWPIRLYFADTDLMGIVYHANYLDYFERARTEWFRAAEINPMDLARDTHTGFVIRHAEIDWLKPLTLDHDAVATVCVRKIGNASAVLEQTIESNGHLSAKGVLTIVCVIRKPISPKRFRFYASCSAGTGRMIGQTNGQSKSKRTQAA